MQLDTGDQPDLGSLVLGLGCVRGVRSDEVIALAEKALAAAGVGRRLLRCIASLDSRVAEPAILAAADHFSVPLRVFDVATLEAEASRLKTPSDFVFMLTGCHGVAEAAALAAADSHGYLIVPKMKSAQATAAVAVCFSVPLQSVAGYFLENDSTSSGIESRLEHRPFSVSGTAS